MIIRAMSTTRLSLLLLFVMLLLTACSESFNFAQLFHSKTTLDKIKESGEIRVLTRNAPTTYYQEKNVLAGLEYDLLSAFAKSLDVRLELIIKDSTSDILNSLSKGEAVLAAAGLTQTASRAKLFTFGPTYQRVDQQLVCRRGSKIPRSIDDLVDVNLWVSAATSYVDSLNKIKKTLPDLKWKETSEFDTEQLLEQVWQKKIACTIADSNIVSINRRYYPELLIAFNISDSESLSWLMKGENEDLKLALYQWFTEYESSGELASTIERYYGFVDLFNYVDLQSFKKRVVKRLPKYKNHFKKAAEQYDQSWTLLAAQSYQESHWYNRAKSPTGVRGMMMLTLTTAREMGIKNRINAKNSIFGGAKYMQKLKKRIPKTVVEPDRTWFALAAYNVGLGHVHDARGLAREMNKNPDKWTDLSHILPLLSQKKYYHKLRHGYARGNEPVHYVKRIRDYHDILEREIELQNINLAQETTRKFEQIQ